MKNSYGAVLVFAASGQKLGDCCDLCLGASCAHFTSCGQTYVVKPVSPV